MQGGKKPPTSEVVETSRIDRRSERNTSPPAPMRRDDRAEPDDDDPGSQRIDVVNVDGGPRDATSSAMVNLRRELAKLHQQAAAVEKSLEDQRRDRTDSADRLERALERAADLEARVTGLEAEANQLRSERDDLAQAVEAAKVVTSEMGNLREEVERLQSASVIAASRTGGELTKAHEQAARAVEDAEKARAEAKQARADAEKARAEAEKAREGVRVAEQDAALVGDQASKIREEATLVRAEADKANAELAKAKAELAKADAELAKTREDVARAKEDSTRDRATARDRIDLLDRALEDARASGLRVESELEKARSNEERLARLLEAAQTETANAESRAASVTAAHAALESNVRRLREDIAGAFARVGHAQPPPLPNARPVVSIPPEMVESVPPDSLPKALPPEELVPESVAQSSPTSKSVPPPAAASMMPPSNASIPPPTYASVPPQIHESAPPSRQGTRPPPSTLGSMPPEALGSWSPPPDAGESSPPARGPGSVIPPGMEDLGGKTREALLAKLVDPDHSEEAVEELRHHPEWLRSVPPPTFVAALASVDYNADASVFELARTWDREPLCHSLIASLRSESDARLREHSAWLLKHFAAPSSWKAIADLARSDEEPAQLRRWLLEALDRLAAGRAIGWRELGELVTAMARHPDATLRDGVVGILVSLDRSDEKRRLLLDILRNDDDEGVLASAVNALASVLPMDDLDPVVAERLLGHPSARVQRSIKDLIERMKQSK